MAYSWCWHVLSAGSSTPCYRSKAHHTAPAMLTETAAYVCQQQGPHSSAPSAERPLHLLCAPAVTLPWPLARYIGTAWLAAPHSAKRVRTSFFPARIKELHVKFGCWQILMQAEARPTSHDSFQTAAVEAWLAHTGNHSATQTETQVHASPHAPCALQVVACCSKAASCWLTALRRANTALWLGCQGGLKDLSKTLRNVKGPAQHSR